MENIGGRKEHPHIEKSCTRETSQNISWFVGKGHRKKSGLGGKKYESRFGGGKQSLGMMGEPNKNQHWFLKERLIVHALKKKTREKRGIKRESKRARRGQME